MKKLTLLDIYTAHVEDDYRLAEKASRGSCGNKQFVQMLQDQAFGAVEGIVLWLNYQQDPDNLVPALLEMWDIYDEKFKRLLEK